MGAAAHPAQASQSELAGEAWIKNERLLDAGQEVAQVGQHQQHAEQSEAEPVVERSAQPRTARSAFTTRCQTVGSTTDVAADRRGPMQTSEPLSSRPRYRVQCTHRRSCAR